MKKSLVLGFITVFAAAGAFAAGKGPGPGAPGVHTPEPSRPISHNPVVQPGHTIGRPQAPRPQPPRPENPRPVVDNHGGGGNDHGGGQPDPRPVVDNHGGGNNHGGGQPDPRPVVDNHGGGNDHGGQPTEQRPRFNDTRSDQDIRNDREFTQRVRRGNTAFQFNGYRDGMWDHYHPTAWWAFQPHYGYCRGTKGDYYVSGITCQAVYNNPANPADPNNGDIYTADSSYGDWNNCSDWSSVAADQTLDNALDQCQAAAATEVAGTVVPAPTGACTPIADASDVDGCFVSYTQYNK